MSLAYGTYVQWTHLHSVISLVIFTNTLSVGKKVSRVNPSDSVGKSVGKNIPRLRLRNSVGNLSFKFIHMQLVLVF